MSYKKQLEELDKSDRIWVKYTKLFILFLGIIVCACICFLISILF